MSTVRKLGLLNAFVAQPRIVEKGTCEDLDDRLTFLYVCIVDPLLACCLFPFQ